MLLRAVFFCHDRMEMFCERASCQAIGGSMHALSCIVVHAWWCLFLRWGGVHYLVIAGALIGVACLLFFVAIDGRCFLGESVSEWIVLGLCCTPCNFAFQGCSLANGSVPDT